MRNELCLNVIAENCYNNEKQQFNPKRGKQHLMSVSYNQTIVND